MERSHQDKTLVWLTTVVPGGKLIRVVCLKPMFAYSRAGCRVKTLTLGVVLGCLLLCLQVVVQVMPRWYLASPPRPQPPPSSSVAGGPSVVLFHGLSAHDAVVQPGQSYSHGRSGQTNADGHDTILTIDDSKIGPSSKQDNGYGADTATGEGRERGSGDATAVLNKFVDGTMYYGMYHVCHNNQCWRYEEYNRKNRVHPLPQDFMRAIYVARALAGLVTVDVFLNVALALLYSRRRLFFLRGCAYVTNFITVGLLVGGLVSMSTYHVTAVVGVGRKVGLCFWLNLYNVAIAILASVCTCFGMTVGGEDYPALCLRFHKLGVASQEELGDVGETGDGGPRKEEKDTKAEEVRKKEEEEGEEEGEAEVELKNEESQPLNNQHQSTQQHRQQEMQQQQLTQQQQLLLHKLEGDKDPQKSQVHSSLTTSSPVSSSVTVGVSAGRLKTEGGSGLVRMPR